MKPRSCGRDLMRVSADSFPRAPQTFGRFPCDLGPNYFITTSRLSSRSKPTMLDQSLTVDCHLGKKKEGFGPARRRTSASPSAERPGRLRGGAGGGKCGGGGHGNGSHRVAWGAAAWARGAHGGKRVMRAGGRCHMPGSRKCRATGTTSRQEENFWARVLRKRPLAALSDPARARV